MPDSVPAAPRPKALAMTVPKSLLAACAASCASVPVWPGADVAVLGSERGRARIAAGLGSAGVARLGRSPWGALDLLPSRAAGIAAAGLRSAAGGRTAARLSACGVGAVVLGSLARIRTGIVCARPKNWSLSASRHPASTYSY